VHLIRNTGIDSDPVESPTTSPRLALESSPGIGPADKELTGLLGDLSREFRQGFVTVWILQTLWERSPLSAYELFDRLRIRAGPDLPIWPSLLYRSLGRLCSGGLVESARGTARGGSTRKYYRLTPAGMEGYPTFRARLEESSRSGGRECDHRTGSSSAESRTAPRERDAGVAPHDEEHTPSRANPSRPVGVLGAGGTETSSGESAPEH
jgi:PadR family transcriptional regulator, regulatory protein PadR